MARQRPMEASSFADEELFSKKINAVIPSSTRSRITLITSTLVLLVILFLPGVLRELPANTADRSTLSTATSASQMREADLSTLRTTVLSMSRSDLVENARETDQDS